LGSAAFAEIKHLLGNFVMKQNSVNVGSYSVFGYKLSLLLLLLA
jgi:hypothetical protein